jgi:hypothetical protein
MSAEDAEARTDLTVATVERRSLAIAPHESPTTSWRSGE